MGMNILYRPNAVNGVVKSSWVATKNPILYKIRREDAGYNQINNAGGFAQIQINGADFTAYWQVDNTVFYQTTLPASFIGTITASAYSGGNTLITTNVAYTVATAGFINNTSKRTDWKVFVEVYKSADNLTLNGVLFDYSPSPTDWISTCNVATSLKNYVRAEWVLPAAVNEIEPETSIGFYIKYQEYYDGGLIGGAQTSDSGNVFHAVHAAMQIFYMGSTYGHGGNLLSYVPEDVGRAWMTRFRVSTASRKLRMWRDWPFSLSFIWPDTGLTAPVRIAEQYDAADALINSEVATLIAHAGFINRLKPITTLHANAKKLIVYLSGSDSGTAGGGPVSAATTQYHNLGGAYPPGTYRFNGSAFMDSGATPFNKDIKIYASDGGSNNYLIGSVFAPAVTNVILNVVAETIHTVPITFDRIKVVYTGNGGNNYTYVQTVGVYVPKATPLIIDVEEPCRNPILLEWKNSTGGDSFYMFSINQEVEYDLKNSSKNKRHLLSVAGAEYVEWEALNELFSPAGVYRENIVELSSAVIKTHTQIGQQVYRVTQSGQKIGVIALDTRNTALTRQRRQTFEIEIEYPDHF